MTKTASILVVLSVAWFIKNLCITPTTGFRGNCWTDDTPDLQQECLWSDCLPTVWTCGLPAQSCHKNTIIHSLTRHKLRLQLLSHHQESRKVQNLCRRSENVIRERRTVNSYHLFLLVIWRISAMFLDSKLIVWANFVFALSIFVLHRCYFSRFFRVLPVSLEEVFCEGGKQSAPNFAQPAFFSFHSRRLQQKHQNYCGSTTNQEHVHSNSF